MTSIPYMVALWYALVCTASGFAAWRAMRRTRFFLHRLQLSGYKTRAYRHALKGPLMDLRVRVSHLLGLGWLLLFTLVGHLIPGAQWWLALLWTISFASSRRYRRDRTKKPLVWTARVRRLGATVATLAVVLLGMAAWAGSQQEGSMALLMWFAGWWLVDLLAPSLVAWAALIMHPLERHIHEGFKRRARARLAERPDLTCIGITGSYGKTSVKYAVRDVLAQRYPVLATPGSFNTPMGISTIINNDLTDDHRMLVLEMGIRHPGDMAELTAIAQPDIAVVTSIGVAHLESMGSIESIAREKLTLLDALREGGTAVVNGDDERVVAGARQKHSERNGDFSLLVVSTHAGAGDCWAEQIAYGSDGARFDVVLSTGERATLNTTLLGRHNVLNILLAIGVGLSAGLRLRQAVRGADRITPVPHRLSMRQENGLTVIDDAFNSNPVGAANAVEVLSSMHGRRIIITPGMIELGQREEELNAAFGRQIADGADEAVLVGPERTRPIREGLVAAGFPEDHIHTVRTLFEAREWLSRHARPGDTVLYENDLPDQFTEAST